MILPHYFDTLNHHKYFSNTKSKNEEERFVLIFERKSPVGKMAAKGKIILPKPNALNQHIYWFFANPIDSFGNGTASIDSTEAWFKEVVVEVSHSYEIYMEAKRKEEKRTF